MDRFRPARRDNFCSLGIPIVGLLTLPGLKTFSDLSIAKGVPIIFAMMSVAPFGAFAGLVFTFWLFRVIGLRKYNGNGGVLAFSRGKVGSKFAP